MAFKYMLFLPDFVALNVCRFATLSRGFLAVNREADKSITPTFAEHGDPAAHARLLLTHGAGAGVTSPFFAAITPRLTAANLRVTLFEFDYMAAQRVSGRRRPPPPVSKLMAEYRVAIDRAKATGMTRQILLIGGKSLGGRVASMVADEAYSAGSISGLVCLGYPFHPAGQPTLDDSAPRISHLLALACPALLLQGERDPFGNRRDIESLALSPAIDMHWVADGDHDFGPRGNSGVTRAQNFQAVAERIAAFADQRVAAR